MSDTAVLIDALRENTEQMKNLQNSIWALESSLNGNRFAIDNLKTAIPNAVNLAEDVARIRTVLDDISSSRLLQDLQTVLESQPEVIFKKV